ncbi:MAG: hypothetical protein R3Y58_02720 [Eubacteriales bacterium]
MFEKKCSLCGGRLSRGICTECGLDNKKNRMHQVNENEDAGTTSTYNHGTFSDDKFDALDHDEYMEGLQASRGTVTNEEFFEKIKKEQREMEVEDVFHRPPHNSTNSTGTLNSGDIGKTLSEQGTKFIEQLQRELGMNSRTGESTSTTTQRTTTYNSGQKKQTNRSNKVLRNIILTIVLIQIFGGLFISMASFFINGVTSVTSSVTGVLGDTEETEEYVNEIEYPDASTYPVELAETGFSYSETLVAGDYIVGVHIPEGIYSIECVWDGSIRIVDNAHDIYIGEYYWEENIGEIDYDIYLYSGASIEISDAARFTFTTENANETGMTGQANPNTETYVVNQVIAGVDIPAGIYDVTIEEGTYGILGLYLPDENGNLPDVDADDVYATVGMFMCNTTYESSDPIQASVYKNLVIPEGALFMVEDDSLDSLDAVTLTPSAVIKDENYDQYYTYY